MSDKYLGSTISGTLERYLVNTNGDIYKCTVLTFKEFSDSVYCEIPENYKEKNPDLVDIFPYGWWSIQNCFENIEDAKKRAIQRKLDLITGTEKEVEKCREKIHNLEEELINYQNGIISIKNDIFAIVDTVNDI